MPAALTAPSTRTAIAGTAPRRAGAARARDVVWQTLYPEQVPAPPGSRVHGTNPEHQTRRQMSLARLEAAGGRRGTLFPDGEVVELALLLPTGQATALETAARQRGLTTA